VAAGELDQSRTDGANFQRLRLAGDTQQRRHLIGPLDTDAGNARRTIREGWHHRLAEAQHRQQHHAHQT
jgi:hypothetical protein